MHDQSDEILPFRTPVDEAAQDDLTRRLDNTRWSTRPTVEDWSQGTPPSVLMELCRYWVDGYDWPTRAALLDRNPQFRTTIDDIGIHFIHVRSPVPDATPLIMTHGWPGSVVEFQAVIGPLTDPVAHGGSPEDAFHLVCPSLPGYGWSDAATTAGWGTDRIATMWDALMRRLGYTRYAAQGGDWGAMVTTALAAQFPDRLIGIHLNMPLAFGDGEAIDDVERKIDSDMERFLADGAAYQFLQSTRPQSLGYGLDDSPAALAGWILEKLWAWSDHGDDIRECFSYDQILDNVMLYWLPRHGASSVRLYWEDTHARADPFAEIGIPVGCSVFPKEMLRTSRRRAALRFTDLRYFNEVDHGGHFAAFEQPARFVDEVRACFRTMR